ncbi:hypothetical protein [Streptomyces sp. BH104]|uniref:hypothetical protein n=1 Tax=Streptomyces sp. BH104 TaxID=3410407 RepID=UPI003BB5913F
MVINAQGNNEAHSTEPGTALLLAAAPVGKAGLIDAVSVLPTLAAVPPGVLTGTAAASVVELADPLDPQAVLTRLRTAAAQPGPLHLYVAGQLHLDQRQRLLHLALARTTPSTLRYTGLPWHWLTGELTRRRAHTTTVVLDLVADAEAWKHVGAGGLGLGHGTSVFGRVLPPPPRRTTLTPTYLRAYADIWRTGARPTPPDLHETAAAHAGPADALFVALGSGYVAAADRVPAAASGHPAEPAPAGRPDGAQAPTSVSGSVTPAAPEAGAGPISSPASDPTPISVAHPTPVPQATHVPPSHPAPTPTSAPSPTPAPAPASTPAPTSAPASTSAQPSAPEVPSVSAVAAASGPLPDPAPVPTPAPGADAAPGPAPAAGVVSAPAAEHVHAPAPGPSAEPAHASAPGPAVQLGKASDPGHAQAPAPAPTGQFAEASVPRPVVTPPPPAAAPLTPQPAPVAPPMPAVAPAPPAEPDPHALLLAAVQAGRHGEAASIAAAWEGEALRVHGMRSSQVVHWMEVRADLARLADEPGRSCELWIAVAHARIARGESPSDEDVEAAVDRAHHQFEQVRDPERARGHAAGLIALREQVPGRRPGALDAIKRRLDALSDPTRKA